MTQYGGAQKQTTQLSYTRGNNVPITEIEGKNILDDFPSKRQALLQNTKNMEININQPEQFTYIPISKLSNLGTIVINRSDKSNRMHRIFTGCKVVEIENSTSIRNNYNILRTSTNDVPSILREINDTVYKVIIINYDENLILRNSDYPNLCILNVINTDSFSREFSFVRASALLNIFAYPSERNIFTEYADKIYDLRISIAGIKDIYQLFHYNNIVDDLMLLEEEIKTLNISPKIKVILYDLLHINIDLLNIFNHSLYVIMYYYHDINTEEVFNLAPKNWTYIIDLYKNNIGQISNYVSEETIYTLLMSINELNFIPKISSVALILGIYIPFYTDTEEYIMSGGDLKEKYKAIKEKYLLAKSRHFFELK